MPLEDLAVNGADLMRMNEERVADRDLVERHVDDVGALLAVPDGRHPLRERFQDRRSGAKRVALERFASREHQHDDGTREIFAEDDRGDDRDAGQQVRSKLPAQRLAREPIGQWNATEDQHRVERNQRGGRVGGREPQRDVQRDRRNGARGDRR